MAPDNFDGKAGGNGRPFEGATLRPHRIIRETMAAVDMQKYCGAMAVQLATRLTVARIFWRKLNDIIVSVVRDTMIRQIETSIGAIENELRYQRTENEEEYVSNDNDSSAISYKGISFREYRSLCDSLCINVTMSRKEH